MAVPALLGIPWLVGVLSALFVSVANFLATYVGKRIALVALAAVAFTALTGTFVVTIESLVGGLVSTWPLGGNIGFVLPDGYAASLSTYFSARIAWWVYSMNWLIIRMRLL